MDQLPYLPEAQQELILASPALPAPKGVDPDFENPPNQNGLAQAALAVCIVFATFSFVVRMYARIAGFRAVKFEDVLTFGAYGAYIGFIYCCYRFMSEYGFFIHQWDVHVYDLIEISYILYVGGVLYSIVLPFLKAAICLEWTRIFVPEGTRNAFWWSCMTLVGIQLSFMVASVFALSFSCIPHRKIWDITVPGHCLVKSKVEIASAAIHLASDLVILLLPQRVIWTLQMSMKQRLGVSIIFSLGVLACLSAAFRLAVTVKYSKASDVIFSVSKVILWALAEMTCGFIVIGMPTAPRILVETGIFSKIKVSIKSWTGRASTTAKSPNHLSGRSSHSKSPSTTDSYQKLDDNGVPLRNLNESTSESTEQLQRYQSTPEKAIIRTTQLTTREDYDYHGDIGQEQLARQHPWRTQQ